MHIHPRFTPSCLALAAFVLLAGMSGCASVAEKSADKKPAIDSNQYVTLDAPVGSHMKRKVKMSDAKNEAKVSELKEAGIAPTNKNAVTAESDTNVLPVNAAQMEALRGAGGP